jgi:glycosyltransferase involved in cell wall biosynthesis
MAAQAIMQDHISVCICTFQRPELLGAALAGVARQVTESAFTFEIVVVDNDHKRSAEDTVRRFEPGNATTIIYCCEPEKNIALARNRAIQSAMGNLIAFIDDDEYPVKEWLIQLYHAIRHYQADGVLGPVLPSFPPAAPQWLKKGNVFDRRRFSTGTRLTVRDTRTGNVLLLRSVFREGSTWFDPAFGLTGGEDVNFFRRQMDEGSIFIWCDEAVAYETVPPERWPSSFHVKKSLRIGALNGENLRKNRISGCLGLFRCIASIPVWCITVIVLSPFGRHLWIPPALKLTYSISCVLSYCGLSLKKDRE